VGAVFSEDFDLRLWRMPERLPGFEDRPVLDYVEQVNRFTTQLSIGDWGIYAQLDQVALMANTYFLDDVRQQERELLATGTWSPLLGRGFDPVTHPDTTWGVIGRNLYLNLEKLQISYDRPSVSVKLGDSYVAFGRGAALNLNRNANIDIDTSLQGAQVTWRPKSAEVTAILGQVNRQQVFQDNPNRGIRGDRRHLVAGVAAQSVGLGKVNVGGHGVVYDFVKDPGWKASFSDLGPAPDAVVGGAWVDAVGLGPLDLFGEVDVFAYPTADLWSGEAPRPGYSIYLSGNVREGRTSLLLEAKRYKDTEQVNALLTADLYEIAIAPTLEYERQITEDSSAALNSHDIWGGRAKVAYTAIPEALVPYVSLATYRDLDLGGLHFNPVPETIWHPIVGVDYTHEGWSVIANVGARIDDRDGSEFGADRHVHGDVISRFPLVKDWCFDLSVAAERYLWGRNTFQQADYTEIESAVSLQKGTLVTMTWYMDYSTNPLIDTTGNLTDALYGAGELMIMPTSSVTVRLFYGAYKSGIRCSGGQCRVMPGFDGARASVTATF
jgi:hypothetical protein